MYHTYFLFSTNFNESLSAICFTGMKNNGTGQQKNVSKKLAVYHKLPLGKDQKTPFA